ncbi:zinc-finger double domain-containing protein [Hirsutella rhossiliensis]|uniref:C2H2 type master regulator of conidiophore development brlA n=1 Tax=Hirsutella rhossiliensis TaxID=111463 RepID=A0A9P8N2T4_9HYPO|nr:zinc-finger double domain-containing protein [Hirsutella rhossiliensis]KAH0967253.1 zinc-finger double domain-containing protein [Hirsutella rhossiliensis]
MDPSHMAFDGHMDQNGPSANDMLNLPLDLDAMMAADNTMSTSLDRLFAQCANDDSCLDHHHHLRQLSSSHKAQASFAPPLPQQHHSTSPLATSSSLQAHPHDYTWENFLNDSALGNSALHNGDLGLCQADDCASECSSECDGSCPSQCGDTGHGVCCDDDACGSPQLCLDEDCQGARRPCMDESCLTDTTLGKQPSSGHAMTDCDKAAAAALASFGGDGPLQMVQAGFMQPPASASAPSRTAPLSFVPLPESLPCGSLSMESMLTNGPSGFPNQPCQMAIEYALASHIMQYHDPSHGLAHTGNCVANDPAQLISRCTLPKFHPNDSAMDPYLSQLQGHECGFQVQDPNAFAQHIFEEHRPTPMLQSQISRFPEATHPQAQVGSNASYHCKPRAGYNATSRAPFGQHFSPSPSPLTNLSVGHSLSTTPSSLTTPSPLESDEDQFLCRWLTGNGDGICGKRFDDDEQLQKHCKFDHLKQLKKARGGFRCGWANCTRDTCFTQRSKVERHMQVHTGYKPVRCEICGASLSAKQALDQHMRIHTGETPWVCKFPGCDCAFKQQSALTMHERTHTGDKPLECEICHKRFSESSNLSKHRRTHNVKGMHECQLCGKDFHRLDQLRRHMGTNHKDRAAEVDALLSRAMPKSQIHRVSKAAKTKAGARGKAGLRGLDADTLEVIEDQLQRVMMDQGSL